MALDRWSDKESDGYRLSNKLTGPDLHLDLFADTLDAHLFGGDFLGQHWTLASASGPTALQQDGVDSDGSGSRTLLNREELSAFRSWPRWACLCSYSGRSTAY